MNGGSAARRFSYSSQVRVRARIWNFEAGGAGLAVRIRQGIQSGRRQKAHPSSGQDRKRLGRLPATGRTCLANHRAQIVAGIRRDACRGRARRGRRRGIR